MQDKKWVEKRQKLRVAAEHIVPELQLGETIDRPAEVLLHELLVHKVELEMQIEELRSNQRSMDDTHDRYIDLFDSTPVAYITVDYKGQISELNLTAATMLGAERRSLVQIDFSSFIDEIDKERWNLFFSRMYNTPNIDNPHLRAKMVRTTGQIFDAQIEWRWTAIASGSPRLRLIIFDLARFQIESIATTDD